MRIPTDVETALQVLAIQSRSLEAKEPPVGRRLRICKFEPGTTLGRLGYADDDGLGLEEFLDAELAAPFAAVAGLLVAAERNSEIGTGAPFRCTLPVRKLGRDVTRVLDRSPACT